MYSPSLVCGINVCLVQLQGMHDMQEIVTWKRDRTSEADLGEPSPFPCAVFTELL